VRFYEVHDQDGCLKKTRNLRVAKQSALAFLRMKSGRLVHLEVHACGEAGPAAKLNLDRATFSWSEGTPPSPSASYSSTTGIAGLSSIDSQIQIELAVT
jgi:hypothetical protein